MDKNYFFRYKVFEQQKLSYNYKNGSFLVLASYFLEENLLHWLNLQNFLSRLTHGMINITADVLATFLDDAAKYPIGSTWAHSFKGYSTSWGRTYGHANSRWLVTICSQEAEGDRAHETFFCLPLYLVYNLNSGVGALTFRVVLYSFHHLTPGEMPSHTYLESDS